MEYLMLMLAIMVLIQAKLRTVSRRTIVFMVVQQAVPVQLMVQYTELEQLFTAVTHLLALAHQSSKIQLYMVVIVVKVTMLLFTYQAISVT